MSRLSNTVFSLLLGLGLFACGGGNNNPDLAADLTTSGGDQRSSGGDQSAPEDLATPVDLSSGDMTLVTADQACTDLAAAICQKQSTCTNTTGITRNWGDMATCQTRQKLACANRLAAPGTTNTPEVTEACALSYPAADCSDFFLGVPPAACATGKTAKGADKSVCIADAQCLNGFCAYTDGSACGVCGSPPALGAACNTTACAAGQYCLGAAGAETCKAPQVALGACTADDQCLPENSCQGHTAKMNGMCEASLGKVGTTCDPTEQTTPACDDRKGLYCNATKKACAAVTYVAAGQPCGTLADGTVAGCKAGECNIVAPAVKGTCQAYLADGAACSLTTGPACLAPGRCAVKNGATKGTCQVPDAKICM